MHKKMKKGIEPSNRVKGAGIRSNGWNASLSTADDDCLGASAVSMPVNNWCVLKLKNDFHCLFLSVVSMAKICSIRQKGKKYVI